MNGSSRRGFTPTTSTAGRIEIKDAVELQTVIDSLDNIVGNGGIWEDNVYGEEAMYWGGMLKRARKILWTLQDLQKAQIEAQS